MPRIVSLLTRSVALGLLTACVQVYPQEQKPTPSAAGQQEKKDESKDPLKKWDDVLKDTRAIAGYFTFHLKRDQSLLLELAPAQLERDFGLVMHLSRGVGDFNVHDGLPLSEARLMRLRRVGDKIYLVHVNTRFTADSGSPMRASLDDNVGHSIVAAFKIESEQQASKHVLVDVTGLIVSDYAGLADVIKIYYGNKPVRFDKERSYVGTVMGFPSNVEIDAEVTFEASDVPRFGGEGVSDYRSVPVGIRYSLFALPETPMRPRLADDRVGYFVDAVEDFSRDRTDSPYLRYVNRWRLEKKDHGAGRSDPVTPIVYYIDRSVPREYRRHVKEGIEAWNAAFETAGFTNAIVVRDAPDDTTWSAEDVRYSTVRWTAAHRMGYAIGPSQTDPRTGEILNADILISSSIVRAWLYEYQQLAGPDELRRRLDELQRPPAGLPQVLAQRVCYAEFGRHQQLGLQYALLVGLGELDGGKPLPETYLGDAIRDLTMHEVGHTLGLRHNFKGSSAIPYDRLQDTSFTRRHGLTLSVMDYGPVNVSPNRARQGQYWNTGVGTYDKWVIQYGYAPIYGSSDNGEPATMGTPVPTPEAERPGLASIARRAAEPLHAFGTDEDNWLGPFALDPRTSAWDLGSDPAAFARDRAEIVRRVRPHLESRLVAEGEGYQRLRGAMTALLIEEVLALLPVTKVIGGAYVARDHKGDPGGRAPFTPIPAATQREATDLLVRGVFAEDAFRFDPEQLNKMAPNRWAHWGMPFFTVPLDYPVHAYVSLVQDLLLYTVTDAYRLRRMIDNEVRMPAGAEPYTVAELLGTLTAAIWSEAGEGGQGVRSVNSFRRNLQRSYLNELTILLIDPSPVVPEDARSLARWELRRLSSRLGDALAASVGLDTATRAHLDESKARIDRALEASLTLMIGR